MQNSQMDIHKARDLANAGHHVAVLEYFSGWPREEIEASPTMSLLYGTAHARLGRPDEGREWVERALEGAREGGEQSIETRALNTRGAIAFVTGRIEEGADYFTQALMAASRDGDHATIGRCSNNLGSINNLQGRHAEALGSYSMAIAAFERAGLQQGVAEARHNLGITYSQQGELDRALQESKLATEEAMAAGDRTLVAMTVRGRAEILALRGELELAQQEIADALESHRELGDAVEEAEDLRIVAMIQGRDGKPDDAERTLRDVMKRAESQQRAQLVAEATRDLAYLLRIMGREDEALSAARAAIVGFEQLGAKAEVRKLDSQEWGYPLSSELREALEPLHEAQRLADQGQYAELVTYLGTRSYEQLERSPTLALLCGIGHARLGRLDEGRQWVVIALTRARLLGERAIEVRALNVYGAIALESGGIDEARGFFMRAQAKAMKHGDLATVGRCANNLGIVADMEGDYGRAVGAYTMAIAAYQKAGFERGAVESQHNLGVTHRDRGDLAQAMQAADRAVRDAEALGDTLLKAQALAGRAEIRVACQEPDIAIREAELALALHRELGDVVRESEDLRILAGALASAGESEKAEDTFRDVIQRATEHARPLLVATAQRDLAHLLSRVNRHGEALELLHAARQTFERLGARIQVTKLNEFLEGMCGSPT
jgi:tetratricopeptide (TPR) repeat protein